MIIRAPKITKPGSVCDAPVISMDFFPTLLELAGLPIEPSNHVDGVSLVPLLKGETTMEHPPLVWHYPHYHGSTWTPGASIRDGDWKLIEFYDLEKIELYNLKDDPGERNDMSTQHAAKAEELRNKLRGWQKQMNAKMPKPNPDYQ